MHFLRLFLCMNAFPEWESGGYSPFRFYDNLYEME